MKINPEADAGGNNNQVGCSAGRKLCAAVGMRRWTASTGTPMITMGFVVLRDAAKANDEGKIFMERFPLVQRASFRIARWALASGHRTEFSAESNEDLERIMSRGPLVATLKDTEYNGKKRVEVDVDGWAAFTGEIDPAWDSMIANGEEEFNRIQQRLEDSRSGGGGYSSNNSAPRSAPAPSDDYIPF